MVPKAGLEPARSFPRGILSPLRLPFRHFGSFWRHHPDSDWGIKVLQTSALPLGYGAITLYNMKRTRGVPPYSVWSGRRDARYRENLRFAPVRSHERVQCFAFVAPQLNPVRVEYWSGRRDSDPRHLPWQGNALPLSHSRANALLLYQIASGFATVFTKKVTPPPKYRRNGAVRRDTGSLRARDTPRRVCR